MTQRLKGLLRELWLAFKQQGDAPVYMFDSIKKSLIRAGRDTGIGHMHFHRFRHTYITWMLEAGVPINQVQYLAGHKDIKMTQRYDHPTLARHQTATATFEAFQHRPSVPESRPVVPTY